MGGAHLVAQAALALRARGFLCGFGVPTPRADSRMRVQAPFVAISPRLMKPSIWLERCLFACFQIESSFKINSDECCFLRASRFLFAFSIFFQI
jgi:hypothetical protein